MATTTNGNPCVDLQKGTLVRPIARYPSSVADDESLKIGTNQVQTTLVMPAGPGDTIFRVSDTSRLVTDILLSIDNEIVSVDAIDTTSGNVTVTRGFDGTIPSAHNAGSSLRAYITAWHHNALAEEIKAIEALLGPNGGNINPSTESIFYLAQKYNFGAQTPGGSLTVGSNVITLTPVPPGVNGANTGYRVWISGGTGAAEAALVTGGTAVAGAASGTLIVTCANSHSGAWTISSGSGGIQEAIFSMPAAGGTVLVAQDVTLHTHVVRGGRTQPSVWKLSGVTIGGSFDLLELRSPYVPTVVEYRTGPQMIAAEFGTVNYKNVGVTIIPEAYAPFPATYGAGLFVGQPDPARLNPDNFFHGIAVDMHTGNEGPFNQNAGVLSFVFSHGGADPFGADLHGIVPDTATAAPTYVIGAQVETQVDIPAPATLAWPLLVVHRSTADKWATGMIRLAGTGCHALLTTDNTVMTGEGFLLIPADDLNPQYRAFAVTNAAGTRNVVRISKGGAGNFDSHLVSQSYNLVFPETGAANAIAGTFQSGAPPLALGLQVAVRLSHSLQAGPNTFDFDGTGAKPIKSHFNPSLDIAKGYVDGAMFFACYDGANWQDMSQ
jgi:hypothetical protein